MSPTGRAPFGTWPSPLTAERVAAARSSINTLRNCGEDLLWVESRPEEGGRSVVVRCPPGGVPAEASPPERSVRSRVHEYGGGAFCPLPAPTGWWRLAFVDQGSQQVIEARCPQGGAAAPGPWSLAPLSGAPPPGERWHHGDLWATGDGRWVLAVREVHREPGEEGSLPGAVERPRRQLVALATQDLPGEATDPPAPPARSARPARSSVLWSASDFVAAARPWRQVGGPMRLAWIAWDHPSMPWDESRLWVGTLEEEDEEEVEEARVGRATTLRLGGARAVAGGPGVSVAQPIWRHDGALGFMSDEGGWWQPWVHESWSPPPEGEAGREPGAASDPEPVPSRRLSKLEAEFHLPDWQLGRPTAAWTADGQLLCRWSLESGDSLGLLEALAPPAPLPPHRIDQPCVMVSEVCSTPSGRAWIGATEELEARVWCDLPNGGVRPLQPSAPLLPPDLVTVGAPSSVERDGLRVRALLHRPDPDRAPPDDRPPLLVHCHGGPTGAVGAGLDPVVQFFTSRGFAVALVDYRGSSGHGRAYRRALDGAWGVADADDCTAVAEELARTGLVDGSRMAIRGSSAGGLTALNALVRSRAFRAAVSWYGVTDLLLLASSTHDFEAHYTDRLIGPLPEAAEEYRRRSPVERAGELHGAVLVLQGLDDPVVPPSQSEALVEAVRRRGRRCDYLTFEGESHGFRRSETIAAALRAEERFYREVFGLS